MTAYGIRHHFDHIYDIVASEHTPKPDPRPYQHFIEQAGIIAEKAVMIEDMARNLKPAADLGMKTVWLVNDHDWAATGAEEAYVHFIADDVKQFLASQQPTR